MSNKPLDYKENEMYYDVFDFHQAFNHPHEDKPTLLDAKTVKQRFDFMLEELEEFLEAKTIEDQADAMIDELYFVLGTLVQMGVKPYNLFKIVHKANMSKLWEDGKPHHNENGKVIKPKGWIAPEPELRKEIKLQLEVK